MSDESITPQPRAVELVADLHATLDKLQTVDLSPCTDEELMEVAAATERAIARTTYAGDRQVAEIEARDLPRKTGCRTLMQFMTHRLRISNPMRRRKQLNATAALTDDQKAQIMEVERGIVKRFSAVLDQINPDLNNRERPLLMPVTMSLFGMMNWVYMWFKDGGRISREDYADVATTLILEGIKAVK
mgnify:CR=1 FL=1